MDEPTSALSNHEVDVLFERHRTTCAGDDVTIIYISHQLDEFRRIGDHVTVLRDGGSSAHERMSDIDTAWIVRQMVGHDPDAALPARPARSGTSLLEVPGLTVPGPARPLVATSPFQVRAGEVVGIYGLMGAGRTELFEALIGSRPSTGEVRVGARSSRTPPCGRSRPPVSRWCPRTASATAWCRP